MTTLGLIGAGHLGSQVARLAVRNGYRVVVSNSRGPETLTGLVAELGDNARAATPKEAACAGDIVIVSIPLTALSSLPVDELVGKIVIDTNNYYPQRDGHMEALDNETSTVSELLQAHLPESRVVKAFNHVVAADLTADNRDAGSPERRALIVAGHDPSAREVVASLIDVFGFDALDIGPLEEGWRIQRDTPGYGASLDLFGLRNALAEAIRYRDM
ncbi:NADP oxidoreductase [Cryobacterium sp. MLB-32]|uniref:NADPH-dependent F420 reductase n=1 Tax=Cryobacterium sp. MLB-32 TaxID=1529318 RepID=UPI0004E7119C|nr:NADPH-dependent F420 reductase [Cryobacterium sp. MLB-32]KFF60874.1 NADP oxidoreductase [Cryobacterium sp. MLB-32]